MKGIPFPHLLEWMREELEACGSIFGIPREAFWHPAGELGAVQLFGEPCDLPLGPAAGPHTQLAQNIVASYLTGGRCIELKTVQKLDRLQIPKPCIDARDEGYNTEWSQELSLEEACDEYLKAWVALHLLGPLLGLRRGCTAPGFIFTMSVGYDLEGIRSERVDAFVGRVSDALSDPWSAGLFRTYANQASDFARAWAREAKAYLPQGGGTDPASDLGASVSPRLCSSVTLSTMHGCPAHEIETICRHLIEQKRLHTMVKLNPTLLGKERVLSILGELGYAGIRPLESGFEHDLRFSDAVRIVCDLGALAASRGVGFGVKLSNTLGVHNDGAVLPGAERYLSGRALAPLTLSMAHDLARELGGDLPISYAGGASALTCAQMLTSGMRPITVATELLKPGGYYRLTAMATECEEAMRRGLPRGLDLLELERLALEARSRECYRRSWRAPGEVKIPRPLPMVDCVSAPCTEACPISQRVPEYIRRVGGGDACGALEVIYRHNALPRITGHVCDHPCMSRCSRLDYEGPVQIRELKRVAASGADRTGQLGIPGQSVRREKDRVAVVGGGPAGLSAAFFLARSGVAVTLFDRRQRLGGVVRHVLPAYRIPGDAIDLDIAAVEELGVEVRLGAAGPFRVADLLAQGFACAYVAVGAEVAGELRLAGLEHPLTALEFLASYNRGSPPELGSRVAVVGGGNTAMDGARTALRVPGVRWVGIVYRRTLAELPADREELDNALAEGAEFLPLLQPQSYARGVLTCRRMALGEADASGRPRPIPLQKLVDLPVDSVISAVGERPDARLLADAGVPLTQGGLVQVDGETLETGVANVFAGGDAVRGGSTVVQCIADSMRAARSIAVRLGVPWREEPEAPELRDVNALVRSRSRYLSQTSSRDDAVLAQHEAARCLECDVVCDRCVEVCPNRANVAIRVGGLVNRTQILHLEALCNECGNCGTFCPYEGLPYRDKLTLFADPEAYDRGSSSGFCVLRAEAPATYVVRLRAGGQAREVRVGAGVHGSEGAATWGAAIRVIQAVARDHGYLLRPEGSTR